MLQSGFDFPCIFTPEDLNSHISRFWASLEWLTTKVRYMMYNYFAATLLINGGFLKINTNEGFTNKPCI